MCKNALGQNSTLAYKNQFINSQLFNNIEIITRIELHY